MRRRERTRLQSADRDAANRISFAHQRNGKDAAESSGGRAIPDHRDVVAVVEHVGNHDHAPRLNGPQNRRIAPERPRIERSHRFDVVRIDVDESGQVDQLAVEREDVDRFRTTKLQRGLRDGVEHRLHIGRRLADHAQDLARCRLALERLHQVPVPHLELVEQPDVLDGDHGLVGERRDQLDLFVGEGFDPRLPHDDDAEQRIVAQQRNCEDRPVAAEPLDLAALVTGDGENVVPVDGPRRMPAVPEIDPGPSGIGCSRR